MEDVDGDFFSPVLILARELTDYSIIIITAGGLFLSLRLSEKFWMPLAPLIVTLLVEMLVWPVDRTITLTIPVAE